MKYIKILGLLAITLLVLECKHDDPVEESLKKIDKNSFKVELEDFNSNSDVIVSNGHEEKSVVDNSAVITRTNIVYAWDKRQGKPIYYSVPSDNEKKQILNADETACYLVIQTLPFVKLSDKENINKLKEKIRSLKTFNQFVDAIKVQVTSNGSLELEELVGNLKKVTEEFVDYQLFLGKRNEIKASYRGAYKIETPEFELSGVRVVPKEKKYLDFNGVWRCNYDIINSHGIFLGMYVVDYNKKIGAYKVCPNPQFKIIDPMSVTDKTFWMLDAEQWKYFSNPFKYFNYFTNKVTECRFDFTYKYNDLIIVGTQDNKVLLFNVLNFALDNICDVLGLDSEGFTAFTIEAMKDPVLLNLAKKAIEGGKLSEQGLRTMFEKVLVNFKEHVLDNLNEEFILKMLSSKKISEAALKNSLESFRLTFKALDVSNMILSAFIFKPFVVDNTIEKTKIIELSGNLDFGKVTVGDVSNRTLIISNNGTEAINIKAITAPSNFSIKSEIPSNILPHSSKKVNIEFNPGRSGVFNEKIIVLSDATSGSSSILVKGKGVEGLRKTRLIKMEERLDFGEINVNETSNKMLRIHNKGNSVLNVTDIVASSGFSILGSRRLKIQPGSSLAFGIKFEPKQNRSYNGYIKVSSDATGGSSTVYVVGRGVEKKVKTRIIDLESRRFDFGEVNVGGSLGKRLRIYNKGNSVLNVNNISIPNGFKILGNTSMQIQPGSYSTIAVKFMPKENRSYNGYVKVSSNATNGPSTVYVFGKGIKKVEKVETRIISLGSSEFDFGEVNVDDHSGRKLIIYNRGNSVLNVSSIQAPRGFSILGGTSKKIQPGSSSSVIIRFSPNSDMFYDGYVQIRSDATGGSSRVYVKGRGIREVEETRIISLGRSEFDFGEVSIDDHSGKELTIYNRGNSVLNISSIRAPRGFSILGRTSKKIQPGSSNTVIIRFSPNSDTFYDGYVQIRSNATSGSSRVYVKGRGVRENSSDYDVSPDIDDYTSCYIGNKNNYCSSPYEDYKGGEIKASVIDIDDDTITIRVKKCEGRFKYDGKAYVKDGDHPCDDIVESVRFDSGDSYVDIEINNDLRRGYMKEYTIVVISDVQGSYNRYHTSPITIEKN